MYRGASAGLGCTRWVDPQGHWPLRYVGDRDTAIIMGVLAVLSRTVFRSHAARDRVHLTSTPCSTALLAEHLSPNRHFGIYAIVELISHRRGPSRKADLHRLRLS